MTTTHAARADADTPPGSRRRDFVFSARVRRRTAMGVVASVPTAAIGGLFVHTPAAFLIAWPLAGSALIVSLRLLLLARRRTPSPEREFWARWFKGAVIATVLGVGLFNVGLTYDTAQSRVGLLLAGYALAIGACVFWQSAVVHLMQARSGQRTVCIDVLDWLIAFVAVAAPGLAVVFQRVVYSDAAWFAIPCALAACVLTAAILPTAVIFARLPKGDRLVEGIFVGLTCASSLNAWLLVMNALANFTFSAVPLLTVQALDMGFMVLLPLYSHRDVSAGLGRLTAEAQVRRHGLDLTLVLAAVPVMLAEMLLLPEARSWAVPLFVGLLGALLCLVAVRYSLVLRETRLLFVQLEHLAHERHQLLASLMRATEGDSHRVAAQLHEEAISALVVLGSVSRPASAGGGGGTSRHPVHAVDDDAIDLRDGVGADRERSDDGVALSKVREDLTARVDALRQLMLAVRTPELDEQSLVTALRVCCHQLFGERGGPTVTIDVDPELVLDWTTRTIVHRIAREAIRSAWARSGVAHLDVRVGWQDDAIVLEVVDDGRPPDLTSRVHESAVEAMRLFARLGGGTLTTERLDDRNRVVARIGTTIAEPPPSTDEVDGAGGVDGADDLDPYDLLGFDDDEPPPYGGLRLVVDETAARVVPP